MAALDRSASVLEQGPDGSFRRLQSRFRDVISGGEAGRYHLYVSLACPWAHRVIIYRHLKGLEDALTMTIVDPERDRRGWAITDGPDTTPDPVNGFRFLSEAYEETLPGFDGLVTVPVLWDREARRIVNNESADIIRMLDYAFDGVARRPLPRLCPEPLRAEIDRINAFVYDAINDGVYCCGFATRQEAYEAAFLRLFAALDTLEDRLGPRRYLLGDSICEADWRLFPTLVRFDPVYFGHFKCNLRRIVDYPNLSGYLRDLYQQPGIADTVNLDHIKRHYYRTHPTVNPNRIVPRGPLIDLAAPHDRARLASAR